MKQMTHISEKAINTLQNMTQKPEYFKNIEFVALDIETTGLTLVVDRIIEIGAVKFQNGAVIGIFQELIDPEMPISPGAFAVNGITDDMVKGRPTIDKVLPRFIDFLGQDIPIAHNAPFDVGFPKRLMMKRNSLAGGQP